MKILVVVVITLVVETEHYAVEERREPTGMYKELQLIESP